MHKDKEAARAYARAYYAGRRAALIAERKAAGWKDKRTGPRSPAMAGELGDRYRAARRACYANPTRENRERLKKLQAEVWRVCYYPAQRARIAAARAAKAAAKLAAGEAPAKAAKPGAVPDLAEAAKAARALAGLIGRVAGTAGGLASILEALARRRTTGA